ncbi:LppP/LprE family lipoprotein [Nocardia sp. NPDC050793]|uniref:LppP/LprE family lipoprotein n=1 Tax=Nocardia sp. NPDC050793 TaxID=3155159 RepID=UPI0033C931F3
MVRVATLLAAAAALATGCGNDDSAQPTPSSQRTTVPASATGGTTTSAGPTPQAPGDTATPPAATPAPVTTPSPIATETSPQPGPTTPVDTKPAPSDNISGPGRCVDPASAGVRAALAGLGEGWVATQASANQPGSCEQLLWVRAVGGNSAGAPIHVLFFYDGKYLGPATSEPYAFTHVAGSNGNSVSVAYRWLVADEPFAAPQGGPVTITYTWTGSSLVMSDPLPKEVTQPRR